jgi:hypothetical protein
MQTTYTRHESSSGTPCIPFNKAYRDRGDFSVTTGTSEQVVQQLGIPNCVAKPQCRCIRHAV